MVVVGKRLSEGAQTNCLHVHYLAVRLWIGCFGILNLRALTRGLVVKKIALLRQVFDDCFLTMVAIRGMYMSIGYSTYCFKAVLVTNDCDCKDATL